MTHYDMLQSFHVDNGELDGLSPQDCFTLGVEWQMIYQHTLDGVIKIEQMVHSTNEDRLTAMLESANYFVSWRTLNDEWKCFVATLR